MIWSEQVVLVTGGTGSFGRKFAEVMLREYRPKKLIIFSRDELKQHEMRSSGFDHPSLRYFIGDVRDPARLERAFSGVTVVIHAAALKQVPACEYNPFEAIQTNIIGGKNVIDAAINQGVRRILALSTDKAVNPINLYGATKLCAEKMFVQANAYSGAQDTRFSCARYGNVIGSRGSVVPIFQEQRKRGRVTVTDPRMTRFWITLEKGVDFVLRALADDNRVGLGRIVDHRRRRRRRTTGLCGFCHCVSYANFPVLRQSNMAGRGRRNRPSRACHQAADGQEA